MWEKDADKKKRDSIKDVEFVSVWVDGCEWVGGYVCVRVFLNMDVYYRYPKSRWAGDIP